MTKKSKQLVAHLTVELRDMDDDSLNTATNARWQAASIRHCGDCRGVLWEDIASGEAPSGCLVRFNSDLNGLLDEVVATIKRAAKKP